jgi:hypothetical protein
MVRQEHKPAGHDSADHHSNQCYITDYHSGYHSDRYHSTDYHNHQSLQPFWHISTSHASRLSDGALN